MNQNNEKNKEKQREGKTKKKKKKKTKGKKTKKKNIEKKLSNPRPHPSSHPHPSSPRVSPPSRRSIGFLGFSWVFLGSVSGFSRVLRWASWVFLVFPGFCLGCLLGASWVFFGFLGSVCLGRFLGGPSESLGGRSSKHPLMISVASEAASTH